MDKTSLFVLIAILAIVNSTFAANKDCETLDPNSESGCSLNCGRKCENINKKVRCPRIYCPPGCQCKPGYYYDDRSKLCVEPCVCEDTC